jgi:antirestriction protein ArdC
MTRPASKGHARTQRSNIYDEITTKIIAELEAGRLPWVQPWGSSTVSAPLAMPRNAATDRGYSGINVLILWGAVVQHGFATQGWLTFRQALGLGGNVRKGEHGTTVVYADRFIPDDERRRAQDNGDDPAAIPFLKRFTVFNIAQCEGLPDGLSAPPPPIPEGLIVPEVEALIRASGADLRLGGDKAFYAPGPDFIQIPRPEAYFEPINWHRTALHAVGNIASVLVAGGAGEGAVERYLRHLHCGEQSPGGGRLDARTAAGAATQRCGVIGIAAGASGIRRRLPASRSSAVLAR